MSEPLTEEELQSLELDARVDTVFDMPAGPAILRLVAEVRRLRDAAARLREHHAFLATDHTGIAADDPECWLCDKIHP